MELEKIIGELYVKLLSRYYNNAKKLVEGNSSDLSFSHINYLEVIACKDRIKPSELAKVMDVSKPAVTSITDILTKKGYIQKKRCDKDKRVFYLSITDKYREYRHFGNDLSDDFLTKLHNALNEDDVKKFKEIMEKIITIV